MCRGLRADVPLNAWSVVLLYSGVCFCCCPNCAFVLLHLAPRRALHSFIAKAPRRQFGSGEIVRGRPTVLQKADLATGFIARARIATLEDYGQAAI
jgi:hypothetical protein